MSMKVGLSGFGRIGEILEAYAEKDVKDFELVAINASGNLEELTHLLKYDTMYGKFKGTIEVGRWIYFKRKENQGSCP